MRLLFSTALLLQFSNISVTIEVCLGKLSALGLDMVDDFNSESFLNQSLPREHTHL